MTKTMIDAVIDLGIKTKMKQMILAIDDDSAILHLYKCVLESSGYDVNIALDGRTGISMLKEKRPDLILLDITMPGFDGIEVLSTIRQFSNTPVIMVTAKSETDFIGTTSDLGADDYISKPFSMSVLTARVKSKLRRIELENIPEKVTESVIYQ